MSWANTCAFTGVNLQQQNLASLHTTPNCVMPNARYQTGSSASNDCDASKNYNTGCNVAFSDDPYSYGHGFNSQGGGYYAMEKTKEDGVRIWFWARSDNNVPSEIKYPLAGGVVSPGPTWGAPSAHFPLGDSCDYDSHFNAHIMVFDLTFCVSFHCL